MFFYQIGRTKYANELTGEGAKINGGRWNHVGVACIYAAESRALAVLEYTVNVNIDDIPRALSITKYNILDKLISSITLSKLPGDWNKSNIPSSTRNFGTKLLKKLSSLAIQIPSAVIPEKNCFLINPVHPDKSLIQIIEVSDFSYDVRIKLK
ncbi:MAG: RES family NAD+ phosphorylase [Chitinophagaceae bacterium]